MIKKLIERYAYINWALCDQSLVSATNFLTGIMLLRLLGLEEFGRFTLMWLVVLFFNAMQMAMIASPMLSLAPKQLPETKYQFYQVVMLQQLIFSCFTFVFLFAACYAGAYFSGDNVLPRLALPLACAGFCFQNQDFLRRYFFSRQQPWQAFFNDVISYLGQLFVLLICWWLFVLTLSDVLWIIAATSFIAVFYGLLKVEYQLVHYSVFKQVSQRHWPFVKWSLLSAILQWGSVNLIFVISGSILGLASVGILKASQNILGVTHVLFQGMENFVPAQASQIYQQSGATALFGYKDRVLFTGGLLTLILVLVISLFAGPILLMIYGQDYVVYADVLRWYGLIYIFIFFGFALRAVLRAIEQTKAIFNSQLIAAIFVMIFTYPLIERFGLHGSLIALAVSYLLTILYLHYAFAYHLKWSYRLNADV